MNASMELALGTPQVRREEPKTPHRAPAKELSSSAANDASVAKTRRVRVAALRGIAIAFATAALFALCLFAFGVRQAKLYSSGSPIGYALGIAGGSLMLLLLLYSLRKRFAFMRSWGPMRLWFQGHMIAGVLGPLLVLFHSTFRVGSFNAGIALASMLLVASSGLVGRFLYRKIHQGLYGSQATLKQLQQEMAQQVEALEPVLARIPAAKQELERFMGVALHAPDGWKARTIHFMFLGGRRWVTVHRIRRKLDAVAGPCLNGAVLLRTVDATLRAAQTSAQFAVYERLFSLWHAVHIPFQCMLVITAAVHVVAVHAY